MIGEEFFSELLAKDWLRDIKFGDLADTQCPTTFKIIGHRCEGVYGHNGPCQDIGYPDEPSKDLDFINEKMGV